MKISEYLTKNNYRWTYMWFNTDPHASPHDKRLFADFTCWSDKKYKAGLVFHNKPPRHHNGKKIDGKYQLLINYDLKDGEAIIDIDDPEKFKEKLPDLYHAVMELTKTTPYYLSRNKRYHHILINTEYTGKKIIKAGTYGVDFLTNTFVWVRADEKIMNHEQDVEQETMDFASTLKGTESNKSPQNIDHSKFNKKPLVLKIDAQAFKDLFGIDSEGGGIIPPDKCDRKWDWMCLAYILQQHLEYDEGVELFEEISRLSPSQFNSIDKDFGLSKRACCEAYYNYMSHYQGCKANISMLYRWAIDADPAAFNIWKIKWQHILNIPINFVRNRPFNLKLITDLCKSILKLHGKEDAEDRKLRWQQLNKALQYIDNYVYQINGSSKGRSFATVDYNSDGTINECGITKQYETKKALIECWEHRGFEIGCDKNKIKFFSLFESWLTWSHRRVYERITFDPNFYERLEYQHNTINELNLYDGLDYKWDEKFWEEIQTNPKKKKEHLKAIKPLKSFLKEVVCSNRNKCYKFLLKFLKSILIGRKVECCLCLLGEKGTGKTFLFEKIMCCLMGNKYFLKLGGGSYKALLNEKNAYFKNKLLCVWDEAGKFRHGSMYHAQELQDKFKEVITQRKIFIRELYKDGVTIPDFMTHIILSNADDAVPIESDSRRFWIMDMLAKYANDTEYWTKMNNHHGFGYDMSRAENEAQQKYVMKHIFHFLLSEDLEGFKAKEFPNTWETIRAKRLGIFTSDKFIYWYAKNNPYKLLKNKTDRYVTPSKLYEEYNRFLTMIDCEQNSKPKHKFTKWCHTNKRASQLFGNSSKLIHGSNRKLIASAKECDRIVKSMEKKWDLPSELKELEWTPGCAIEESDEEIPDAEESCSDSEDSDECSVDVDTDEEIEEVAIDKFEKLHNTIVHLTKKTDTIDIDPLDLQPDETCDSYSDSESSEETSGDEDEYDPLNY